MAQYNLIVTRWNLDSTQDQWTPSVNAPNRLKALIDEALPKIVMQDAGEGGDEMWDIKLYPDEATMKVWVFENEAAKSTDQWVMWKVEFADLV